MTDWKHAAAAAIVSVSLAGAAPAPAPKPLVYWGSETAEATALQQQYRPKHGTMGKAAHAMVAACHDRSVEIGLAVLRRGGSAADAFIAVTFADYVQSPGASSMGGPMAALIYDARARQVVSLGAPLRAVQAEAGQWRGGSDPVGRKVLVPGAVAGLEALHRRYGRLPWAELVRPATELARNGFPVNALYAGILNAFAANVKGSAYGRATYFHADGTPLRPGEVLKLPEVADTLDHIGAEGAAYFYHGKWGAEAVAAVNAAGGAMAPQDLATYAPEWGEPFQTRYRDATVYAVSGHDSGGARLLLALQTLEHADIARLGHYSESLDGLETMVRVTRAVTAEPTLWNQTFFDNRADVERLLDGKRAAELWAQVAAGQDAQPGKAPGSHSYSVVVVDSKGNVVAGTHTIESLPFGSGIFVAGVPLNDSAILHPFAAGSPNSIRPGAYEVEPMSAMLAFRGRKLVLAGSTFSASLWPADFQAASSVLDFGWDPERIALTPRFGSYAINLQALTADPTMNVLDKRYSAQVVEAMKARGLKLSQEGYVDTGMIVLVTRSRSGALAGFTPEQLPEGRAAGY